MMLADSAEAAVRATVKPTPPRIEKTVRKVIAGKIDDHQLDWRTSTLAEIETSSIVYTKMLASVYHPRVEYPRRRPRKESHAGQHHRVIANLSRSTSRRSSASRGLRAQAGGGPELTELSIALVDDDEMAHLNEQYRGIDGPTDVLSFGCDDPCVRPGDEPITLGDVVIAPAVAERQAAELGTRIEHELNLLLVHGVLHLLGYDHEADDDAAAMQAREAVVLDAYAAE